MTKESREKKSRSESLPTYVFSMLDQLKEEAKASGKQIIDLGMGNPDQATPPHIVEALIEAAKDPANHRYSASKGIPELREAICEWYKKRYNIDFDPSTEAIFTLGSKEGIAHLSLAILNEGDIVLAPNPAYPIHTYGPIIAGAKVVPVRIGPNEDFEKNLIEAIEGNHPKPTMLFISFPSNPTTECVDLAYFEKIIRIAKKYGILVAHDLAYADLAFDGYKAPSIMEVEGAKEVAIEFFTLSKSYNMPGWRVGFMVGNASLVAALAKIKSYLDYGAFAAIQKAAVVALTGPQDCVKEISACYEHRRNILCDGLNRIGWSVDKPKATMFVWAKIPEKYRNLGSMKFAEKLINEASVAVSPGIGFGAYGDGYVRFSLIVEDNYAMQAIANIEAMFNRDF